MEMSETHRQTKGQEMNKVIIISGDIVDGFRFFGPFGSISEAISWAEEEGHEMWQTADIQAPE